MLGMNTLFIYSMTFILINCTLIGGFFIEDMHYNQRDRNPGYENSETMDVYVKMHKMEERRSKTALLRILREIQQYSGNGQPMVSGDRNDGYRMDKRDYGIMPPWHELCRIMNVPSCKSPRS